MNFHQFGKRMAALILALAMLMAAVAAVAEDSQRLDTYYSLAVLSESND